MCIPLFLFFALALECQLENEHEERTLLLRERHELERRLAESEERERSGRTTDHDLINRLKRDLKKTKVLLHDSQLMLQRAKTDAPNKALLRQLRNQVKYLCLNTKDKKKLFEHNEKIAIVTKPANKKEKTCVLSIEEFYER